MSSKKNQELLDYLEDLDLEDYYEAFQKEKLTFSDLEFLEPSDTESVIPKRVHRRKFLKSLESLRSKKKFPGRDETNQKKEGVLCEKEGERVHMFVKCKQEVRKVYEVPVDISNEELIGRLLQAFLECELKLQDEEITLVKELKSFTLKEWKEKNELSPGKMLRAVLSLEGAILNTRSKGEEVEKLRAENTEVKCKLKIIEKEMEKVQKEAESKGLENEKLKRDLEKALMESKAKSKKLKELVVTEKKEKKKKKKEKENIPSFVVPVGFNSHREFLVPQSVVFEVNEKYRSVLKKIFSNGNKVAKGMDAYACFKTSTVFTAGKKFYFQASANVEHGGCMGFGILSGEVCTHDVGDHEKGWSYHCFPGWKTSKTLCYHNKKVSSGYGPERTLGKHKFGIFCDFTNGKGEVSFIVDGKNWGVAYRNVEPPVSPAFYIYMQGDSFSIEDYFVLPDCV